MASEGAAPAKGHTSLFVASKGSPVEAFSSVGLSLANLLKTQSRTLRLTRYLLVYKRFA